MKTQQTPTSLSSGIWCVTVIAFLVCLVFCVRIQYKYAHFPVAFYWSIRFQPSFQCPSTSARLLYVPAPGCSRYQGELTMAIIGHCRSILALGNENSV